MVRCCDGFAMSVQASSEHACIPRNDTGPYAEVEVGYPNQLEPLLMPFRDAPSLIVGAPPVLYVRVPAHTIRAVVAKHAGLRHDSYPLPDMEDRDEDGFLWAAPAMPPTSSDTDSDDSAYVAAVAAAVAAEAAAAAGAGSPQSMIHLGAPPPPPPPLPPATPEMRVGELTPPPQLRYEEMSPIEKMS